MALLQETVTVSAAGGRYASPYGRATWDTELPGNPKLVAAVVEAPADHRDVDANPEGVTVRARIDGSVVTVDLTGPATGPVPVLVTVSDA